MQREEARLLSDLKYIRDVMELSATHKLLPDWAAIVGGLLVLAATALTWNLTRSADVVQVLFLPPLQKLFVASVWTGTAAASVLLYWVLALRESRRLGVSLQARPTRMARQAMGPALLTAGVITLRLLLDRHYGVIPSLWMLGYGVALYNAGLFSSEEPRLLGLLFIVTGIAAMFVFPDVDLWIAALSFGGYHIAFGAYVLHGKRA